MLINNDFAHKCHSSMRKVPYTILRSQIDDACIYLIHVKAANDCVEAIHYVYFLQMKFVPHFQCVVK